MKKSTNLILTALFAALIAAGCFIIIPLPGGIPIAIQDMMAMLTGLLLGPLYGSLAVIIFLLLGVIGLPVYTGKAGIQVLLHGATCGFLWGYLVAAFLGGLMLKFLLPMQGRGQDELQVQEKKPSPKKQWIVIAAVSTIISVIFFGCGIAGYMIVTGSPLSKALAVILYPFIPGNTIKIVLMTLLAKKFRPIIWNYTH